MDPLTLIEKFTEGQLGVLAAASALLHEPEEKSQEGATKKRSVKKPPKPWSQMKGDAAAYLAYLDEVGV